MCCLFFPATHILILNEPLAHQSSLNCAPFLTKKWVTAKKISPVHYTSEPKPTDFCSLFLTTLKKKNHILHSSLLIAWPLACGVQKKRGKSMHIEEELSTKLFYYVYLCKWHIRLFKKVSVAPPLSALWSAFPPCSMDGWMSGSGRRRVRNWFYANLYKRRM